MDASGERVATATARLDEFQHGLLGQLRGFVCGLLGGDFEEACDVVQEVFVAAWQALGVAPWIDDGDSAAMHKWLHRVAYHKAISRLRHRSVLSIESIDSLMAERGIDVCAPGSLEELVLNQVTLQAALARLSPMYRACVLLSTVQGYTAAEVAEIVGIEHENAKKRIARGKIMLREELIALGWKA